MNTAQRIRAAAVSAAVVYVDKRSGDPSDIVTTADMLAQYIETGETQAAYYARAKSADTKDPHKVSEAEDERRRLRTAELAAEAHTSTRRDAVEAIAATAYDEDLLHEDILVGEGRERKELHDYLTVCWRALPPETGSQNAQKSSPSALVADRSASIRSDLGL